MGIDPEYLKSMPDVAQSQVAPVQTPLDFVGMENIELPLLLENQVRVPARANIFVNIADKNAKGIHMSRLYLVLKDAFSKNEFSYEALKHSLGASILSQEGLASKAKIEISWEHLMERPALLSENSGWKSYPVKIEAVSDGKAMDLSLSFSVLYSSTCPCSSALSRQLLKQDFESQFTQESVSAEAVGGWLKEHRGATPHSQRSQADVTLSLGAKFDIKTYVDAIEQSLKTPVQTAVKREDEQEFARLNGQNLMFVEDALRKMKETLDGFPEISDFKVKASHYESLHAHDAVGYVSKHGL